MIRFDPLQTPRLEIRRFRPGDAPGILGYAGDPQTTRYMAWPRHRSLEDSEAVLRHFLGCYESGRDLPLAVVRRDGALLGSVGYEPRGSEAPWASWIFASAYWRQGYALEAVTALLRWAWRNQPALQSIGAPIHPDNAASIGLARRLGFAERPSTLRFRMVNLSGREESALLWSLDRGTE